MIILIVDAGKSCASADYRFQAFFVPQNKEEEQRKEEAGRNLNAIAGSSSDDVRNRADAILGLFPALAEDRTIHEVRLLP